MQLEQFSISGLFGGKNHEIAFPIPNEADAEPSLLIIHGKNGVGKTTILRMIAGLMRLDFDSFRDVPFESASLRFTSGQTISVKLRERGRGRKRALSVAFDEMSVDLHSKHHGAADEGDTDLVNTFRKQFFEATSAISFEFINTRRVRERFERSQDSTDVLRDGVDPRLLTSRHGLRLRARGLVHREEAAPEKKLALRVKRFVRDAQVDYREYFSTTAPDLFPRILERLASTEEANIQPQDLRERLDHIRRQDEETSRLGLGPDKWDYDQLISQLNDLSKSRRKGRLQALAALDTYSEFLESRAAERKLVADRLLTFEKLVSEFFVDKSVTVDPAEGLVITADSGAPLTEHQLSSGEFHLLFLMVAALKTRRLGTVVAIDEPEMSMHVAWQTKLVPALIECASGAEPLFIFATHSPDLAAEFPDAMIDLN